MNKDLEVLEVAAKFASDEEIKKALTNVTTQFEAMKKEVSAISKLCDEYKKLSEENLSSVISLNGGLRSIFLLLSSKKKLFKGDKEIEELLNTLAKHTLSSGSIKGMVVENANK